jgi:hypothetical protein
MGKQEGWSMGKLQQGQQDHRATFRGRFKQIHVTGLQTVFQNISIGIPNFDIPSCTQ